MPTITHNNIEFDSENEIVFYEWLNEAIQYGFVEKFEYHPKSFKLFDGATYTYEKTTVLKTKTKIEQLERSLLQPHVYTCDFLITPTAAFKTLNSGIPDHILDNPFHVDTKGGFSKRADLVTFPIDQKWVYEKYGVFVVKIVPEKLFLKTWVPEYARYTKVRKEIIAKYTNAKTIKQFLGLEEFVYTPIEKKENSKIKKKKLFF